MPAGGGIGTAGSRRRSIFICLPKPYLPKNTGGRNKTGRLNYK